MCEMGTLSPGLAATPEIADKAAASVRDKTK